MQNQTTQQGARGKRNKEVTLTSVLRRGGCVKKVLVCSWLTLEDRTQGSKLPDWKKKQAERQRSFTE